MITVSIELGYLTIPLQTVSYEQFIELKKQMSRAGPRSLELQVEGQTFYDICIEIDGFAPNFKDLIIDNTQKTIKKGIGIFVKSKRDKHLEDVEETLPDGDEITLQLVHRHIYSGMSLQTTQEELKHLFKSTINNFLPKSLFHGFQLYLSSSLLEKALSPSFFLDEVYIKDEKVYGKFSTQSLGKRIEIRVTDADWSIYDQILSINGRFLISNDDYYQNGYGDFVKITKLYQTEIPEISCHLYIHLAIGKLDNDLLKLKLQCDILSCYDPYFDNLLQEHISHNLSTRPYDPGDPFASPDPDAFLIAYYFSDFSQLAFKVAEQLKLLIDSIPLRFQGHLERILTQKIIPKEVMSLNKEIQNLVNNFKDIKNNADMSFMDRLQDLEALVVETSSSTMEQLLSRDIEGEIESTLGNIDCFNNKTQNFIRMAFTIKNFQALPDYSPVLLGLSKAIETELELIFSEFRDEIYSANQLEEEIISGLDIEHNTLSNEKKRSTRSFYKYLKSEQKLEIGSMNLLLRQAFGSTGENVEHFIRLKQFVLQRFGESSETIFTNQENGLTIHI